MTWLLVAAVLLTVLPLAVLAWVLGMLGAATGTLESRVDGDDGDPPDLHTPFPL